MFDRIEAGTYLIAGALTESNIRIKGIDPKIIKTELDILKKIGSKISKNKKEIHLIIISSAKTQDGPPAPGWNSGHSLIFKPFTRTYLDLILFNATLYSKIS